jgi:hypothetical protein
MSGKSFALKAVPDARSTPDGRPDVSTPWDVRENAHLLWLGLREATAGPTARRFGTTGYTTTVTQVTRTAKLMWDGLDDSPTAKEVMDAILRYLAETGNLVRERDHWWIATTWAPDGKGREFPPEPEPVVVAPPPRPAPPPEPATVKVSDIDPVVIMQAMVDELRTLRAEKMQRGADASDELVAENLQLRRDMAELRESNKQLRADNTALRTLTRRSWQTESSAD